MKLRKYYQSIGFYNNEYSSFEDYCCKNRPLSPIATLKTERFQTDLHYSDEHAREERTVFGTAKKGLFYNYSDRLFGEQWDAGCKKAKLESTPGTAAYFEIILKHFHDSDDLDLQHVILGCNMSNGFPYLVFGYTYTSKSKQ